jgi:PAS domain S-box-containing protein
MSRKESPSLPGGGYIWGLAAAWTALVILLLGWNLRQLTRETLECARACACTHFEKDVLHRHWNASHGGVYVPVTEGTPPNPFLAHLPEREVRTPSGRLLTLVNPTSMTRQVHGLAKQTLGVKGHITSLKPLRPENAADAWETAALRAFEQGKAEVSGVVREDGQDYLRLMRPLVTERACLDCHAAQGYKLGEVRGGISVTMPLAPFWGTWRHHLLADSLGLGLLWLLGLLGICWGGRRLRRSLRRQQQSEEELRRAHGELERRVQERTAELAEANTILKEEIGERRRVEETLRRRIDLEHLISSISKEFVQLAGPDVNAGINRALQRIGEFAGVEYAFVIQFSPAGRASSTHEWCAPGLPSQMAAFQGVPLAAFPWSWGKLKRGESLQVPRLSDLPPEAAPEKETLISLGYQSFMAVPLLQGEEPLGTLGFASTREEKPWAPEDFALLQVLAEIFVHALDRRQAEAALKESEEKYRLLVNQVPAVVFKGYADWSVDFFDNKIEALTGYSKAEFDARQVKWCEVIHPEDLEAARKVFLKALKTTRSYVREHRIRKKTGEISWVQGRGQIFLDDQGEVDYVSGLLFDISERKQAEEALCQSEEQLRQAVKMEAIGRLAGGVAHDFNNIMTAIRGHGELLLQSLEAEDPRRGDVADILQAATRAASLTRQLLAFSRQQVCQPRVLDLNEVVENLDKMLKRVIGEDIDLVFVPGPGLGQVRADPGQMEQVIVNLAVNARDAMPRGGKLTLETANVELDGEYAGQHPGVAPGRYVLLAVSDTGGGLDAEAKAHLFEPFFTTKEPGQGTGLGLSTVYGIVKQNRGHITVYSEPGQGATFKVYLPRLEDAGGAAALTPALREPCRGGETVLLVEDEDLVRQVVRRMLERNGYQVLKAARGQEALRLSEDHPGPIHLVLTDVVMPGMNGRETATALLARRPEVRVLYMSGHTENAIVHHGVLEMGLAFIQKPFKYEDLMAKVREILEAPSPPRG